MTDIAVAVATAETSILDVAKQASGLAIGLQNAAPSDKANTPNKSIQYLLEIAERLNTLSIQCQKLLAHEDKGQGDKLLELTKEAVQSDQDLREKYQIADKFRFIRDRLHAQLTNVQEVINAAQKAATKNVVTRSADEVEVYVYLFNAQGIILQSWHKMVSPSVFYEHSVNRPIYTDKAHVETFISHKPNKIQHGYLTIVVNQQDILKAEGAQALKDSFNNPLIKVKEGSLRFNKLISFTHNGHTFIVNEEGGLIKKT